MGYPDRSNDPKAAINYGHDYNFFITATPGSATPGTFAADCDVLINLLAPTYTVTFNCYGGVLQYSFNGNVIHGTMDSTGSTAPAALTFQNRAITKIWFAGTGTVRVEAWAIR